MRQAAPANPPTHPFLAVIEAAIQPEGAREDADPPLNSRSEPETSPKPPLLLMLLSFLGEFPLLGSMTRLPPTHWPTARSLVIESLIRCQKIRRPPEALSMSSQALRQM